MAFQNLRTGSTVYIFHKDNSPKLEIGQVIAEPKIRQIIESCKNIMVMLNPEIAERHVILQ